MRSLIHFELLSMIYLNDLLVYKNRRTIHSKHAGDSALSEMSPMTAAYRSCHLQADGNKLNAAGHPFQNNEQHVGDPSR